MYFGNIYITVVVLVGSVNPYRSSKDSSDMLKDISSRFWSWKLGEYPEYATIRSEHKYNDRLDEYSLTAFARRKEMCEYFITELDNINMKVLPLQDQYSYEILVFQLKQVVNGYRFAKYGALTPLNFLEGIQRIPSWIWHMRFRNKEDYHMLEKRLQQVPKQIDDIIKLMEEAVRLKRTSHKVSVEAVPSQIQQIIVPGNFSVFFWPYRDYQMWPLNFTDTQREELRNKAINIINKQINPAYIRLKKFLIERYLPNTRSGYGVGSFDNGLEYYEACLRFHLSSDVTAQQIHDIGLKEVHRIKQKMKKIMVENGFNGTIAEFVQYLRTNKTNEYYNRSASELLVTLTNIIEQRIQPEISKVISNQPPDPIKVRPSMYDGPAGSYGSNTFWVNLRESETRPVYTFAALALHEANPGHHLQISYVRRLPLPNFRRYLASSDYYAVPFNFPWYTVYSEGWALYAEYLGEEMGIYNKSALEMFGRYSYEIFRATRLVVDTGIHAFGKSREWAIEYLINHTAITRRQIETEIDRYITWPGQACGYKVGEMEFKRNRKKAEALLGEMFDVKKFHEVVLNLGRCPMSVVEKAVDNYIKTVTGTASKLVITSNYITIYLLYIIISHALQSH